MNHLNRLMTSAAIRAALGDLEKLHPCIQVLYNALCPVMPTVSLCDISLLINELGQTTGNDVEADAAGILNSYLIAGGHAACTFAPEHEACKALADALYPSCLFLRQLEKYFTITGMEVTITPGAEKRIGRGLTDINNPVKPTLNSI